MKLNFFLFLKIKRKKIHYWGYVFNPKTKEYGFADPAIFKKKKNFKKVGCTQRIVIGIEEENNQSCGLVGIQDIGCGYNHVLFLGSGVDKLKNSCSIDFNPKIVDKTRY